MRRFLSASLLALSSALPAMANENIPVTDIAFSPDIQGNFYTSCVTNNLEKHFPDTDITIETRETRDGSVNFTVKAPFEDAVWLPDGVHINGAYENGMIERVLLSTRRHNQKDSKTQYHSGKHGYHFFQNYTSHELSQFSETFRKSVEAIRECPTTELESRNVVTAELSPTVKPASP